MKNTLSALSSDEIFKSSRNGEHSEEIIKKRSTLTEILSSKGIILC